jgi:hypothetical protein
MTTLNITAASTLATLHATKKEERQQEELTRQAQTATSKFDDIVAEICNQIASDLTYKANNEDETPAFSLEPGFCLRRLYATALSNLSLTDEFNGLSDVNMYKRLDSTNTTHYLNTGFQSFLETTHSISFSWLSNSASSYADTLWNYNLSDIEISSLNTNRNTFELFLIDQIKDEFSEEGYVINNTTGLIRKPGTTTCAIYSGSLIISVS